MVTEPLDEKSRITESSEDTGSIERSSDPESEMRNHIADVERDLAESEGKLTR